ncbi:MAG: hypothetical protein AB1407_02470 [Spirochaetota bacterium]
MRQKLAAFLLLLAVVSVGAMEDDYLQVGMGEDAVVSVFTQYRSCANVALEEGPGWLAWDAQLGNRLARVEVAFLEGRAVRIVFRYVPEVGESGGELLDALVEDESRRQGSRPTPLGDVRFRWDSPGRRTTVELLAAGAGWEARIIREAVPAARP